MPKAPMARFVDIFRAFTVVVLCLTAAFYIYRTVHWNWQWDTSIMHYVNLLMDHGKAPYRDIIDMNMPGSYFMEGWAMRVFGTGDLGWRIYEYVLLAILTTSMIVIAKPYDWLAGLFAGIMFAVAHGAEGPQNTVQREEVMTVLIVAGVAFGFTALRRQWPQLMLPFGFLLWLAVSLKPTVAPLGLILFAMALFALHKRKEPLTPYLGYGLVGFAIATFIVAQFLLRYQATADFFAIMKRLLPYYAGVGNHSISSLIADLVPRKAMFPMLLITLVLTISNKSWKNWERQALALIICFGAFSFVAQRKGFLYHRIPFFTFLLLWMGLEFTRAMKLEGWRRSLGVLCAAGMLLLIPGYCVSINKAKPNDPLADALTQDLEQMGGAATLQNQVQCIDMVSGCLGALYRLGLVQNMGYMGDYMFFGPPGSTPSTYYRDRFMEQATQSPPGVIVVTTAWFRQPDSFTKIDQWPQFVDFLNSHYTLDITRMCDPANERGYRIYKLKPAAPSHP